MIEMFNYFTVLFLNVLLISECFGASVKGRNIEHSNLLSHNDIYPKNKLESTKKTNDDLKPAQFEQELMINQILLNPEMVQKILTVSKKNPIISESSTKYPMISTKIAVAATTTPRTTIDSTINLSTDFPSVAEASLSLELRATATGYPCPPAELLTPCLCTYEPATFKQFLNCRAAPSGTFEDILSRFYPTNKLSDFETSKVNGSEFFKNTNFPTALPVSADDDLSLEMRATATGYPCPPASQIEPCICTYEPATYRLFLNCRAAPPGKFQELTNRYSQKNASTKMAIAATTTTTTTSKTIEDSTINLSTNLPSVAEDSLSFETRATATGYPCPSAELLAPCLCTYEPATFIQFLNCRAAPSGKFEELLSLYYPMNKLSDYETSKVNGTEFFKNTKLF